MFRVDMGMKKQGAAAYALSALDIGLWDITGKALGKPLYKLWGAVRHRIPCYGSGGWAKYGVDDLVREAEKYAALGCRYYKMKIHDPDPKANRERVEAVKRALGPGVRLMVDVNQRLDVLGNVRQARCSRTSISSGTRSRCWPTISSACAEVAKSISIPGRHRREQLHALRIPRADRAQGRDAT